MPTPSDLLGPCNTCGTGTINPGYVCGVCGRTLLATPLPEGAAPSLEQLAKVMNDYERQPLFVRDSFGNPAAHHPGCAHVYWLAAYLRESLPQPQDET